MRSSVLERFGSYLGFVDVRYPKIMVRDVSRSSKTRLAKLNVTTWLMRYQLKFSSIDGKDRAEGQTILALAGEYLRATFQSSASSRFDGVLWVVIYAIVSCATSNHVSGFAMVLRDCIVSKAEDSARWRKH